jgi:hypothetical protein
VLAIFFLVCASGSARAASPLNWSSPALVDHQPPLGSNHFVSCPSASLCVVVDGRGNAVTSTDPTGGASAWTVRNVDGSNMLGGVSCPSASLCVAVDGAGDVLTSTSPTGGASAWTVTNVDGSNSVTGVSCPSTSLCVAVDNAGNVLTSTDPSGGASAWTASQVDPAGPFTGVSCVAAPLCVAVDSSGDVVTSTDPTGGASVWTVTQVENEAEPPGFHVHNELTGVSCPSVSLCVAVDLFGSALTSTNPTGGANAWTVTPIDNYLQGVSCPLVSLCVAVGAGGNVTSSTDPTGGSGAWTETQVDGSNIFWGVSCPSASLCVAVDDDGNVVVGTSSGGAGGSGGTGSSGGTSRTGGASPPPVMSGGPTVPQIRAALSRGLVPHGKGAKIGALLKHGGYTFTFNAPSGARVMITWFFLPTGAHISKAKPVKIASARVTFTKAGAARVKVRLTGKGRELLRHAKSLKVIAKDTFTPGVGGAVGMKRSFKLRR